MTQGTGKMGLFYSNKSGANVQYVAVSKSEHLTSEYSKSETRQISSEDMSVTMNPAFPRIIEYTLKSNNSKLYGQEIPYYIVG